MTNNEDEVAEISPAATPPPEEPVPTEEATGSEAEVAEISAAATPPPAEFSPIPGDLVQLKSGGIPMTVEGVQGQDVSLVWHDSNGVVTREIMLLVTLMPVPPKA